MEKINFENLPSENTPINQDNLNLMQGNIEKSVVAVGKTQPSTSENVWIKKGKNLFDLEKLINSRTNHGTNQLTSNSLKFVSAGNYSFSRNVYTIPAELLNKQVTLSFNAVSSTNVSSDTIRNSIFISTTGNESGDVLIQALTTTNTRYTVTFTPTIQNLQITLYATLSDATTQVTQTISNIQLEQNSTATSYEPYVEKEILIKNDNNVFENFYSEKEHYEWEYATLNSYVEGTVIYVKIGNLVIVQFDDFIVKENISSSGTVLAYGLPKSNKYIRTELVSFTYPLQAFRVAINEEGNIVAHYSDRNAEAGTNFYGSLIYLTD